MSEPMPDEEGNTPRSDQANAPGEANAPIGSAAIDAVHDTYRLLDDRFDDLYAACQTDAARAELRALHAASRDAYWKAIASGLAQNTVVVQNIRRDLVAANTRIRDGLASLQNVTAVLHVLTDAVRLAGALVGLAGVG